MFHMAGKIEVRLCNKYELVISNKKEKQVEQQVEQVLVRMRVQMTMKQVFTVQWRIEK